MKTIYRCGGCNHKHLDHAIGAGSSCSMGGCRCQFTDAYVEEHGVAKEVQTWPGFDHATGKWAIR